jgi:hypothetical protein
MECGRHESYSLTIIPGVGAVETGLDVFDVKGELASCRSRLALKLQERY